MYAWMRLNVLGEITRLPNGFSRVFMQSQIFVLPACVALFVMLYQRLIVKKWRFDFISVVYCLGTITTFSVIVATLSRSFWLGLSGGLFGTLIVYIRAKRSNVKAIIQSMGLAVGIVLLSGLLLFSIIRFPYPKSTADVDASLLSDRATKMEAGAASRWSLLPVMWTEIIKSPLWGYGYGKTVTYFTSDPRITSTTVDGRYTTYAFEWGWFDIWLKFGLLGFLVFGWLVISMIKDTYHLMKTKPTFGIILCFSMLSIVIVHFFTPYLNHPLGFGYLGIILLILQSKQTFNENFFDKASH
jgi:O-antigen ligase